MKIVKNLTGILLLLSMHLQSQKTLLPKIIKPLNIGDTMPDIDITNIYNYEKSTVKFSDFKGKFVIIDFWFGACPACIEAFPKMEALQKKFGNQIQIIMVNFETQKQIDITFKKWRNKSPNYRNPKLPSIVSDTIFHQLFPHQSYPHEVWIDKNGIVKAFTSVIEVNEANIQAMLENKPLRMDMKIDNISFDDSKYPILSQVYAAYPSRLRYYAIILSFIPGLSGGWHRQILDSSSKTVRVSRRNMTILQLFTDALLSGSVFDPLESPQFDFGKRVVLQIKDSSRYFYQPGKNETKGEWQNKNCYTYESVMPLERQEKMQADMLLELERFFNSTCTIGKRKMKCLALIRTSAFDKIQSKEGKTLSFFDKRRDTAKLQIYAGFTAWLVEKISIANRNTPYIFVDDTGYTGRIDIEFDKKLLSNLPRLKNKLRTRYELDLIEKEREVDVMIFREKGQNPQ